MGLKRIKWNFEKFLIGKDGTVKGRYVPNPILLVSFLFMDLHSWASTTKPEALQKSIEDEINSKRGEKAEL